MANVYDIVRSLALLVGVGYSARQGRKTWMWADAVMWGTYALGIFLFPRSLFPGNENELLPYLIRVFASVIIGMETMWYLSRDTRDDNVVGATLWTRLMGSLVLIAVWTYSYAQHNDKFPEKTLYFDALAYVLLLLSTVYQFWRGTYTVGGREQKGHVSTVLRIMFLVCFFTGLLDLTYPSWVLYFKRLTIIEAVMVRSIGALFIGLSFTAWYATSFRYDEDRSSFFLSQITICIMMFVSLNMAYFIDGVFTSQQALVMHIGLVPSFLVLIGLYLLWKRNNPVQYTYNTRSKDQ